MSFALDNRVVSDFFLGIRGTESIGDIPSIARNLQRSKGIAQAYAGANHHTAQTDVLTNGLVGSWSFDGPDVSGTTATDRSGQGHHGTLTGGPVWAVGRADEIPRTRDGCVVIGSDAR